MKTKKSKILLIGPALNKEKSNLGGATLSFTYTTEYFRENNYLVFQINTQKFSGLLSKVFNLTFVLISCFLLILRSSVVFANLSQGGIKYLAPILVVFAKLSAKKIIIRAFGGAMDVHYEAYSKTRKAIFRQILKHSDIFYVETKSLKSYFADHSSSIKQLVNPRKSAGKKQCSERKEFNMRFVFVGQVRKDKGVLEILNAMKNVDPSIVIHIYGPIVEDDLAFLKDENSNYMGILPQEKVLDTLRKYDVLLLPTYYQGEGYPGIIVEAFSIGMPVISTNWRAISELVKSNQNGVLIEPKSTESLIQSIHQFRKLDYASMSKCALDSFNDNFQINEVMSAVEKDIRAIVEI